MITIIEHGTIHELRLQRPPVNALNDDLLQALEDAVRAAPVNGARALILSGGEKVFSGGLDVPYLMTLDRSGLESRACECYGVVKTELGRLLSDVRYRQDSPAAA